MTDHHKRLARLHSQRGVLRVELATAVREALADGVKATEVARILGVSRQRVYQIVHEEETK